MRIDRLAIVKADGSAAFALVGCACVCAYVHSIAGSNSIPKAVNVCVFLLCLCVWALVSKVKHRSARDRMARLHLAALALVGCAIGLSLGDTDTLPDFDAVVPGSYIITLAPDTRLDQSKMTKIEQDMQSTVSALDVSTLSIEVGTRIQWRV